MVSARSLHLPTSRWAGKGGGKKNEGEDENDSESKSTNDRENEYIYNPLSTDPSYLSQIWPTGKVVAISLVMSIMDV